MATPKKTAKCNRSLPPHFYARWRGFDLPHIRSAADEFFEANAREAADTIRMRTTEGADHG